MSLVSYHVNVYMIANDGYHSHLLGSWLSLHCGQDATLRNLFCFHAPVDLNGHPFLIGAGNISYACCVLSLCHCSVAPIHADSQGLFYNLLAWSHSFSR